MEKFFFYTFAAMAVLGALATVTRKSPLASALSLVVAFIGVSGLYFLNDAPFAAALQILVYAGAIMVLVIFVIMLLNLPEEERLADERLSRPGMLLTAFLLAPLGILCIGVFAGAKLPPPPEVDAEYGSVAAVGRTLFEDYVFQFEIVSILLMVAVVGAVILAKKKL